MEEKDILNINNIVQKEHDRNINRLTIRTFLIVILGALGTLIMKAGINEGIINTPIEKYSGVITITLMIPLCIAWVFVIKKQTDKLIRKRESLRAKLIFHKLGGK